MQFRENIAHASGENAIYIIAVTRMPGGGNVGKKYDLLLCRPVIMLRGSSFAGLLVCDGFDFSFLINNISYLNNI